MMTQVSFRRAVSAVAMIVALAFITGATIARAQGAAGAGAGSTSTAAPPPHAQPGQTSNANSTSLPAAANTSARTVAATETTSRSPASSGCGGYSCRRLDRGAFSSRAPHLGRHRHRAGSSQRIRPGLGRLRPALRHAPDGNRHQQRDGSRASARFGERIRATSANRRSHSAGGSAAWSSRGSSRSGATDSFHPAYARYMAVTGSNFLSNTWRADSEADWQHALAAHGLRFRGPHRRQTPGASFGPTSRRTSSIAAISEGFVAPASRRLFSGLQSQPWSATHGRFLLGGFSRTYLTFGESLLLGRDDQ